MSIEEVTKEAEAALKFADEKAGGIFPYGHDFGQFASIVTRRVLHRAETTGLMVPARRHEEQVEKLQRRANQFSNSWAAAKVEADQQLQRVQGALESMEDQELAKKLADEIGVMLPEPEKKAA